VGEGDGGLRVDPLDQLPHPPLMLGVGIGVEKTDGDRLYPPLLERLCRLDHAPLVQLLDHLAIWAHPLKHLEPVAPRDQGSGLPVEEVIHPLPVMPPDLIDVAEALGGQ